MFEPLKELFGHHAEKLNDTLQQLRAAVISNTEAQLERTQSARKSIPLGKKEVGEIRNDSGYGWRVKWVSATTAAEFFLGVNNDESFMLGLKAREGKEVEWYIPAGGILFAVNTSEAEGFANIEVDVLVTTPVEGFTGPSGESTDTTRVEPVPSGTPLDDVHVHVP